MYLFFRNRITFFSNEIKYHIYYDSVGTNSIGTKKKRNFLFFFCFIAVLTFNVFIIFIRILSFGSMNNIYAHHLRVTEDILYLKNEINFDLNKETN